MTLRTKSEPVLAANLFMGDIIILDGVEVSITKVTRDAGPFVTIEWVSTEIAEQRSAAGVEECEDNDCTGCEWCDIHGITAPGAAGEITVEPTDEILVCWASL